MEYDPVSKRILFDQTTYRLAEGVNAPAALISWIARHLEERVELAALQVQRSLTTCARHEAILQWDMNAIHDAKYLMMCCGAVKAQLHGAVERAKREIALNLNVLDGASYQKTWVLMNQCKEQVSALIRVSLLLCAGMKAMRSLY